MGYRLGFTAAGYLRGAVILYCAIRCNGSLSCSSARRIYVRAGQRRDLSPNRQQAHFLLEHVPRGYVGAYKDEEEAADSNDVYSAELWVEDGTGDGMSDFFLTSRAIRLTSVSTLSTSPSSLPARPSSSTSSQVLLPTAAYSLARSSSFLSSKVRGGQGEVVGTDCCAMTEPFKREMRMAECGED